MVYRKQTLDIYGATLLGTTSPTTANELILINAEGWDTFPELKRNTAPKLFGDGEYQSTAAQYGSKTITLTFQAYYDNATPIRNLRETIRTLAAKINDLVAVDMKYYEDDVEVLKERLLCRPAEPFLEEWEPVDNAVTFTLNYTAPNPYKAIYLAGGTTPEETGKL